MKKILFVILIGFLGFFISCTPNPLKIRNVEGTVILIGKAEFNNFNGNFITWENKLIDTDTFESGTRYQIWFIYPPQKLPKTPFKLKLTYVWIQRVLKIPVVRVLELKMK